MTREESLTRDEARAYRKERRRTDPAYAARQAGCLATLVALVIMLIFSAFAFIGGRLPVFGWRLAGGFKEWVALEPRLYASGCACGLFDFTCRGSNLFRGRG